MLFKKKKFPKLTSREIDILNILWENEKSLIASEIADARPDLTINTVQAVLRKLLKYQLIEYDISGRTIADIPQCISSGFTGHYRGRNTPCTLFS